MDGDRKECVEIPSQVGLKGKLELWQALHRLHLDIAQVSGKVRASGVQPVLPCQRHQPMVTPQSLHGAYRGLEGEGAHLHVCL